MYIVINISINGMNGVVLTYQSCSQTFTTDRKRSGKKHHSPQKVEAALCRQRLTWHSCTYAYTTYFSIQCNPEETSALLCRTPSMRTWIASARQRCLTQAGKFVGVQECKS